MVYVAEVRLGSKKETNRKLKYICNEIFQYAKKTRSFILALISVFGKKYAMYSDIHL